MMTQFPGHLRRRHFLTAIGALTAFSIFVPGRVRAEPTHRKGRLKQTLCGSVFSGAKLDFEGTCREAARLGAWGIDLVGSDRFATLKSHGLIPSMVPGGSGIKSGINDKNNHAGMRKKMEESIKAA